MKNTFYKVKHYIELFKRNKKIPVKLSPIKKFYYLYRGFLSEKYYLYELYKNDYRHYLSDFHIAQARWINDPYSELLSNKYLFYKIFNDKIQTPKLYGIIINGKYIADGLTFSELIKLDKFILKPILGGGGQGIVWIQKNNDNFLINQNQIISAEELEKKLFYSLNNYLVCEQIKPSSFSLSLYPNSINTIRILTLQDITTGNYFIAAAAQRIGVKTSAPQDNFSRGGLSANINVETGELSDATTHPFKSKHIRYDVHPETQHPIKGQTIPNWKNITFELISFLKKYPFFKAVGWDILLTDNGFCIIEGNHHADPDVLQCHKALLIDNRIKNFYKYHKIIK